MQKKCFHCCWINRSSAHDLAHCAATAETRSPRTSFPVSTSFHYLELPSIAAQSLAFVKMPS